MSTLHSQLKRTFGDTPAEPPIILLANGVSCDCIKPGDSYFLEIYLNDPEGRCWEILAVLPKDEFELTFGVTHGPLDMHPSVIRDKLLSTLSH